MPAINKPNQHFDATLYTGNGGTQSITNSGFQPDFVWYKQRNTSRSNGLEDSVRGATKILISDTTAAEVTASGITSFNSNGFTQGSNAIGNDSGGTFVAWHWKAGGAAVTNTSGTISSQVSANPTAGFSIVTYTGTGANATVGHGLGVAPSMIIIKNRSSAVAWIVYHSSLGNTKELVLNTTAAEATNSDWNNTSPTSTVFSLGVSGSGNGSGNNLVAYCFAAVAGYSAFGSYTGNGSADGPFVYTGFRPRFILYKRATGGVANWVILDTARDTYNLSLTRLFPSNSDAETAATAQMDILSNGFKIRVSGATDTGTNGNGDTYIYAAFAEAPFKYSNGR